MRPSVAILQTGREGGRERGSESWRKGGRGGGGREGGREGGQWRAGCGPQPFHRQMTMLYLCVWREGTRCHHLRLAVFILCHLNDAVRHLTCCQNKHSISQHASIPDIMIDRSVYFTSF